MASSFQKHTKVKLDLLIDIDIILLVQKVVKGRICHSIYRQKVI